MGLAVETENPSFLAVHPNQRFLYAVNEVSRYEGSEAGSVSAFSIDRASGTLTLLNRVSSRGGGPCHLSIDATGKWLFVANYGGGSVAAFPLRDDGTLGEATAFVQHAGSSVNPARQKGPLDYHIPIGYRFSSGVEGCPPGDMHMNFVTRAAWHPVGGLLGSVFFWVAQ